MPLPNKLAAENAFWKLLMAMVASLRIVARLKVKERSVSQNPGKTPEPFKLLTHFRVSQANLASRPKPACRRR
jgi:hypothetical protein